MVSPLNWPPINIGLHTRATGATVPPAAAVRRPSVSFPLMRPTLASRPRRLPETHPDRVARGWRYIPPSKLPRQEFHGAAALLPPRTGADPLRPPGPARGAWHVW